MAARILVHPRCVKDKVAQLTLDQTLTAHGRDTTRMVIGPANAKGHRELVTRLEEHEDGSCTYSRGDGTMFRHPQAKEVA